MTQESKLIAKLVAALEKESDETQGASGDFHAGLSKAINIIELEASLRDRLEDTNRIISDLKREIEQDKRDAERIKWLELYVDGFNNIDRISSTGNKFNGLPSLREAIDAAIAAKKDGAT